MKLLYFALFVALARAAPAPQGDNPVEVIVNGVPDGHALEVGDILDIKLQETVNGEVAAVSNPLHPFSAVGIVEAAVAAAAAEAAEVAAAAEVVEVAPPTAEIEIPDASNINLLPAIVDLSDLAESVLPSPVAPEYVEPLPAPAVLPSPVAPEVIETVDPAPAPAVLPSPISPEVIPEPAVLPSPVAPEVIETVDPLPAPAVLPPVAPEATPELPEPEVIFPAEVVEAIPEPAQNPTGEIFNNGVVQVSLNINQQETGVLATLSLWVGVVMNYINNGVQYTQQLL